jgi:hypothetical protein
MIRLHWTRVWTRAVILPASRRGAAAILGCGIVAAVVFGPTAMRPADLTGLALHAPAFGAALAATWLLVFVPTARMILRAAPAAYLESLPGNPRATWAVSTAALIVLQLPWVVLWIWGEGWLGAAIVVASTVLIVAIARWRPPQVRARFPVWRSDGRALRAIHLRALRRRAGDALVRGAGLAILAGAAGGLLVRNNHLRGEAAGVMGASIIAVVLIPAQIGAALVTLGAHRETAWVAQASGIAPRTRIAALVFAIAVVHVAAAAIAVVAATAVAGAHPWLPVLTLAVALGTSLGEARAMLAGEDSPMVAVRVVVGAITIAAIAVVCLAVLGAAGALAILAVGAFALLGVRA